MSCSSTNDAILRVAQETLSRVQTALAEQRSKAIDIVYDTFDAQLEARSFDEIGATLRVFADARLSLSIILSALVVTRPYRASFLDAWQALYAVAKKLGAKLYLI